MRLRLTARGVASQTKEGRRRKAIGFPHIGRQSRFPEAFRTSGGRAVYIELTLTVTFGITDSGFKSALPRFKLTIFACAIAFAGLATAIARLAIALAGLAITIAQAAITIAKMANAIAKPAIAIAETAITIAKLAIAFAEPAITIAELAITIAETANVIASLRITISDPKTAPPMPENSFPPNSYAPQPAATAHFARRAALTRPVALPPAR